MESNSEACVVLQFEQYRGRCWYWCCCVYVCVFSRRSRRECQGWGRGRHGGTWGAGRWRTAAETVMMRMGARDQETMLTEPVSNNPPTHTHTHLPAQRHTWMIRVHRRRSGCRRMKWQRVGTGPRFLEPFSIWRGESSPGLTQSTLILTLLFLLPHWYTETHTGRKPSCSPLVLRRSQVQMERQTDSCETNLHLNTYAVGKYFSTTHKSKAGYFTAPNVFE